ncbi:hypothetical protein [Flavobacterium sp.]|uniref:hypothetical protein n=1 Tax=Flavobacterium sp. TaxID=239 RepID=UPI00286EE064|nr:hypothetical protein [Flavobacterium sp.]
MIKNHFFVLGLFLMVSVSYSQTGIGTTSPDASAKLEVSATNKGFLPPRVTLTSGTDNTTIPSPATGLLVYNTGNNPGLVAGYYYWNGAVWTTIATAGGSGSVAAEYGSAILGTSVTISSATPTDVLSFTLPSAGTWELIYFLRAQGAPPFAGEYGIYDPAETLVPNSEILAAYGPNGATGTGVVRVTTTGAAIYKIKGWASYGSYAAVSEFNGKTGVTWKKISGNAAMSVINYGDVKTGFQSGDHNGWVKLNGRLKSTLSATQQAQATILGIGTYLPDASNAFLVQNGSSVGTVSGSNSITLAQNQLPNVNYIGQIAELAHGAAIGATASGVFSRVNGTSWGNAGGGGTTETFNLTIPLNGGVTQQQINITPKSLSINTFIYLGF